MRPSNRQSGFTIVEVIIYLAIFIVVSISAVGLLLSLDDFINQYRIETALYRSGTNAMEQIILSIRQGDNYDPLGTIQHASSTGRVTLENSATTTRLSKEGDDLELQINGTDFGSVLESGVIVENFYVYPYTFSRGEFVRVQLDLSVTVGSTTKSASFYGGASVRGAI